MGYIPESLVRDRALIKLRLFTAGLLRFKRRPHSGLVSRIRIGFSLLQDPLGLRLFDISGLFGKIRPSDLADTRKHARFYTDTAAAVL